ncbi:MAG: DMT family transporter [Chloroflexi bacterium]|nr:DMT family transporter [Chloroflexota bacterium]
MVTDGRSGDGAAAGAAALFGSAYVATAVALQSFGPLPIALWRGVGAATIVGVLVLRDRRRLASVSTVHRGAGVPVRPWAGWLSSRRLSIGRLGRLVVLGLLGGPAFIVGMNLAVSASGATIASFVAGLYAVLAAVLAPFVLRERLGPSAIAGFAVALLGTALLAELDPASASIAGIVAGLGAAAAFAAYLVLSRRWARDLGLSGLAIVETNFTATALVLLPLALVVRPEPVVPATITPDALLALGWLIVASVGGQLLIVASVRRIAARRSAAFLLVNPITATVLAAILLGERLAPIQLVGAALVLVGIALASDLAASVRGWVAVRAGAPS